MVDKHTNSSPWRNPWVIAWVALILVVLGVNLLMVSIAVITSPGLVTEEYYDKGRNYARYLEKKAVNAQLRWQVNLQLPETLVLGQAAPLRVVGVDTRGVPLNPDRVTARLYRPSDSRQDFTLAMSEERPGTFRADVSLPLKGVWDLIVSVQQGDQHLDVAQRLQVVPR